MRSCILIVVSMLVTAGWAHADAKTERAKFNGKWVAVVFKFDGMNVPSQTLKEVPWYWTIDDERIVSLRPGSQGKTIHRELIEIRLVEAANPGPKAMDMVSREGKEVHKTIYEFDGDTLRICVRTDRKDERPDSFNADKGSNCVLMVFQRVKE